MMQRNTTSQLSRKARTRVSIHGINLSAIFAGIAVSAALLAGSATGSPILSYSDPVFPGPGHNETGSGFSSPWFYGIHGNHFLGKSLSRRWSATHSLKAVDVLGKFRARPANLPAPLPGFGGSGHGVLGLGRFNPEEPFRCEPDPLEPEAAETEQEPQPKVEPSLSSPPIPSAVPEPGTWILFAFGLTGLLGLRSLRKSRAP